MTSLHNHHHFPAFAALPTVDEVDFNYYAETPQGMVLPSRTWCFVGEIVNDSLAQMPTFGNRVEVRDVHGEIRSVLFYPESGGLDFSQLRAGHTLFIRYAQRIHFADLSTEAIKVDDLDMVKIINASLDSLLALSHFYFSPHGQCLQCGASIAHLGGGAPECGSCHSARYCSPGCLAAHAPTHASHCLCCSDLWDVFNIDFDRFITHVPFRCTTGP